MRCDRWSHRKLTAVVGAMTQPQSATQEVLAGYVERVTYHNAENGFCVLRAKARGHRDVVTVVGHAATISAGEYSLRVNGSMTAPTANSSGHDSCEHRRQLQPTASRSICHPA